MEQQPILTLKASSIAAEIARTVMLAPDLDETTRDAAAALALWLTEGPHDRVARISSDTMDRIYLGAGYGR